MPAADARHPPLARVTEGYHAGPDHSHRRYTRPIVRGAHPSVEYVIRSRGIAHVGMAGNVRLFDAAAAQWIGSELQRIAAEKEATR